MYSLFNLSHEETPGGFWRGLSFGEVVRLPIYLTLAFEVIEDEIQVATREIRQDTEVGGR